MPKIRYISKNFRTSSQRLIVLATDIIEDYMSQGMRLTLRQLYYRFVAADLIENKQSEYNKLGSVINDARLAGLIDWSAIEDRGRNLNRISFWGCPSDIIVQAAGWYNIDKWEDQEFRVEVWVEKQALEAIIQDAAGSYDCPSFACKGYTSQSEMWRAARRFINYRNQDQTPVIIHLGDHDPSGIDMTRDIRDRMEVFGMPMEINRIALNMDQIDQYEPPPNPAKQTDSRAQGYIAQFGYDSWELDALEPSVLRDLIVNTISGYMDMEKYQEKCDQLERERNELTDLAEEVLNRDES